MKKRAKTFWRQWGVNILRSADAAFNRIAILAGLVAFFGLEYSNFEYSNYVLGAVIFYLLVVITLAKPPYVPPPNLSQPISLEKVNVFLAETPRVGIVGLRNAGKTTLINATVARKSEKRETEKPYGQFVSIPDTDPERHVVLLDSVGARAHVQFTIQAMANCLLFLMDHSESDSIAAIDLERLSQHESLANQLIHAATDNQVIVDRLIVVVNKSDLWQSDSDSAKAVDQCAERIMAAFQAAAPYRQVSKRIPFSNESRSDVADLLREVSEG